MMNDEILWYPLIWKSYPSFHMESLDDGQIHKELTSVKRGARMRSRIYQGARCSDDPGLRVSAPLMYYYLDLFSLERTPLRNVLPNPPQK